MRLTLIFVALLSVVGGASAMGLEMDGYMPVELDAGATRNTMGLAAACFVGSLLGLRALGVSRR